MSGRIAFIDALRAASILYITGFWHLMNYTKACPGHHNPVTIRLTVIVLGLFVFLSGYLLGAKKDELDTRGMLRFYGKRVLRIYPLFILAALAWAELGLTENARLVRSVFLYGSFHGPNAPTLWFISTLFVYYLLAPLLMKAGNTGCNLLLAATVLFLALWLAILILPRGDIKLVQYFPAFVTGLYMAGKPTLTRRTIILVTAGAALAVAITFFTKQSPENCLWSIPMTCLGSVAIFLAAKRIHGTTKLVPILGAVSYASYALYLFHRPVYVLMTKHYPPIDDPKQILYLLAIGLPIAIGLSWCLQKSYDTLLKKRFAIASGSR